MRGSVVRQSKNSWRLKWDLKRGADGKRQTRTQTVTGTRKQAEAVLTQRLHEIDMQTACPLCGRVA
jgi:type IV secretory pathway TrbF-like protein